MWLALTLLTVFLLALITATAYVVLRAPARARICALGTGTLIGVCLLAAAPWLVVALAPVQINVKIHGIGPLLLWCALSLGAFAALVLAPLAAVLALAVWIMARRRAPQEPAST
jgi:hypothetical protein